MAEPALGPALPARASRGATAATGERHAPGHAEADSLAAARLARTAAEVARDWGLSLGEPFALSRYSYVAPAGDDAVLKVVPPEDDESTHEAAALAFWSGDGAVRLIRADRARRAMLLERARPGHDASSVPDADMPAIAMDVGSRLWRTPPADAPYDRIGDRVPLWLAQAGDDDLVRSATALFTRLGARHDVLVHGDFHHHNLLRHDGRWIAIDPKPIRGEREYDVVTLLWNPIDSRPTRERIERTIAAFAARGLDAARVRAWCAIRATYLGHPLGPDGRLTPQLRVARMLLGLPA